MRCTLLGLAALAATTLAIPAGLDVDKPRVTDLSNEIARDSPVEGPAIIGRTKPDKIDKLIHKLNAEESEHDHDLIQRDTNGGGLLDLGGLLDGVLGVVGDLLDNVLDIVDSLDPFLANTVGGLLNEVYSLVNRIERILDGVVDAVKLSQLLKNVNSLVSQIESLLTGVLSELSPRLAKEVKTLLRQLNKLVAGLERRVGKVVKRDGAEVDGPHEQSKNGLLGIVGSLVNLVNDVLGQVENLLSKVVGQLPPSLAKTLTDLLGQVNKLVRKIENVVNGTLKDVDLKGLLDELDGVVDELVDTITDVVKAVDPSLGRQLKKLLGKVLLIEVKLERQVEKLL